MTDTSVDVAYLQSHWYSLGDLDRAEAVKAIHRSGISLRNLAARLNCSPSLMTHLLQAAQAPIKDQMLARQGTLSTRALVRSARAIGIRRTAMHREAIELERELEARQHSRAITRWLDGEGVKDADRGFVVEKARLHLSLEGGSDHLPPVAMPADNTVRTDRSTQYDPFEISRAADFAWQLAHWVYSGIRDIQARQRALELACDALTSF